MVNASAHLLATKEDDADSESREEDASIDSCVRDVGQKWWNRQSARRKAKPTAAAIDPFWVKYTSGFAKGIQVADHPSRSSLDPTMWNKNYVKVRRLLAICIVSCRCLREGCCSLLAARSDASRLLCAATASPLRTTRALRSPPPGHGHRLTRIAFHSPVFAPPAVELHCRHAQRGPLLVRG